MKMRTLKWFVMLYASVIIILIAVNVSLNVSLTIAALLLIAGLIHLRDAVGSKRFLSALAELSGGITDGDFQKRIYLPLSDDFAGIARSLNTMTESLQQRISVYEEEKAYLRFILRNVPDALLIIRKDGVIELTNDAFKSLFGDVAFAGRPIFEVIRHPDLFSLMDTEKKSLSPAVGELWLELPEPRFFTVRISPLSYENNSLSGFVAILHDSTKMKKLEEMRRDFVANVSHEIKTPVTAIQGFAETLLDGALDDKDHAEKFLEKIRTHSERLNRLVDDLLTLSAIELGSGKLNIKEIDTADVIDYVIETLRGNAEKKGLDLRKVTGGKKALIKADSDRLTGILLNIVDNSIKFTERGYVEIGTTILDSGAVVLSVKDTGVGIPEKFLPRLGERFFRVDSSRSREIGGTGLGLAIVKHLVRAHGWKMQIESKENTGTTVRIRTG